MAPPDQARTEATPGAWRLTASKWERGLRAYRTSELPSQPFVADHHIPGRCKTWVHSSVWGGPPTSSYLSIYSFVLYVLCLVYVYLLCYVVSYCVRIYYRLPIVTLLTWGLAAARKRRHHLLLVLRAPPVSCLPPRPGQRAAYVNLCFFFILCSYVTYNQVLSSYTCLSLYR